MRGLDADRITSCLKTRCGTANIGITPSVPNAPLAPFSPAMEATHSHPQAWTVARLLSWTRDYLARHAVDSPRLAAELLLAHAMGCDRIQLYTRHAVEPAPPVRDAFRELVRQAGTGCPVAYLTGTKEFFSIPFVVTRDVLIPRPETETLVERCLDLLRARPDAAPPRVLDLCTGSGCVAVSLARHLPDGAIVATDLSDDALRVARLNAERQHVAPRIDFRQGDLFDACPGQRFDVIVSNPPYVAERDRAALPHNVREFEPGLALFAGHDGLSVISRIIHAAPDALLPAGSLLLEIGAGQADAVRAALAGPTWSDVRLHRDQGVERVAQARLRG